MKASVKKISEVLQDSRNHKESAKRNFSVTFVWNPVGFNGAGKGCTLCQDTKELFILKTAEEKYASDFRSIFVQNNLNSSNVDSKAALRVKAYLDDMTPGDNYLESSKKITDEDLAPTRTAIVELAIEMKRLGPVIVVAHSQGNLLANLAWASYASEIGNEIAKKVRVVNVANTSQFSVNFLNLTHAKDAALFSAATDKLDKDISLETLPRLGGDWNRTTPTCKNAACNFSIDQPYFGGVDGTAGTLDHALIQTYLSETELPQVLHTPSVFNFSPNATRFRDRFEDLVYAANESIELLNVKIKVSPDQASLGKDVTFTISGDGLNAGMGFSVEDCLPSNNEISGGTSRQRQFRCTFAGATGKKKGVLKAAPGSPDVLQEFEVEVGFGNNLTQWGATITVGDYTVKKIINYNIAEMSVGPSSVTAKGQYIINRDSTQCRLTQELQVLLNVREKNSSAIEITTKAISPRTTCPDGSYTAEAGNQSAYVGNVSFRTVTLTPAQGNCDFMYSGVCHNFLIFSPLP